MKKNYEYNYVGHYIDTEGNYVLKIGTTNNPTRRQREHNRTYRTSANHPMAPSSSFEYDWIHAVTSEFTTLRVEKNTKKIWRDTNIGEYIRNDRFVCREKPNRVSVKVKKVYEIYL